MKKKKLRAVASLAQYVEVHTEKGAASSAPTTNGAAFMTTPCDRL
jgi:hypothetical protein